MRKLRELSQQEKLNAPAKPPVQQSTGFGSGFTAISESLGDDFEDPFA